VIGESVLPGAGTRRRQRHPRPAVVLASAQRRIAARRADAAAGGAAAGRVEGRTGMPAELDRAIADTRAIISSPATARELGIEVSDDGVGIDSAPARPATSFWRWSAGASRTSAAASRSRRAPTAGSAPA
jgi:hypothetical protein